ncbi:MAG: hypothetical protein EXQ92_06915 [Alphaproteobacteria bacterium]|nr:hypothetical protein [Alphaproteobacteria bacterium]
MLGLGLIARLFRKLIKYTLVLAAFAAVFTVVLVFAYDWAGFIREQLEGFANRTGLKVSIGGVPHMEGMMPPTLVVEDVSVQQPLRDRANVLREVVRARRAETFFDVAQSFSTGSPHFGLRLIEPQIQMSSNLSLQTVGQQLGVSSVSVSGGTIVGREGTLVLGTGAGATTVVASTVATGGGSGLTGGTTSVTTGGTTGTTTGTTTCVTPPTPGVTPTTPGVTLTTPGTTTTTSPGTGC